MDGVLVVGCCWFTMAKNNQDGLDLVICGNLLSFRDEPHTSPVFALVGLLTYLTV